MIDGRISVSTVTDKLQDALAAADDARLAEVAVAWSQTDEFYGHGQQDGLTDFLTALAELAREATSRRERLYCWIRI